MDNKQNETPNPINHQTDPLPPDSAASQPIAAPSEATPTAQPVTPSTAASQAAPTATEQTPKKTGLIAGIIIGLLVLIGGAAAAAIMLMPQSSTAADPVDAAMKRIMAGETSKNVAIDGEINILNNDTDSEIKRINIKLDSDIAVGTMINTSSAILTLTTLDDKDISMTINEIYASDGSLYFEVENLSDVSELEDADEISEVIGVIKGIEGTWLRFSPEEFSMVTGSLDTDDSTMTCIADFVKDLDKKSGSTAEFYDQYPFVTSTTEGVIIPKKQTQVYLVGIDDEKFTNYLNSVQNSAILDDVYTCLGYEKSPSITTDDVTKLTKNMPKAYVEVNGNNDFSRLYIETDIAEGAASMTLDFNFQYLDTVNVNEPVEYTDFTKFIEAIMSGLNNNYDEVNITEIEAD